MGVGSPGLDNVAHGLQRLVIDLYELLGLFERRFVLGNHQHDSVTHAAGDIALGDDVPVLDKVADLVDRHVLGAQDAHHAGQGLGLGSIDGEHTGARVLGAHGAGIGQTRLIELVDVVGILALAEHLLAHVDAEGALAHAVVVAALQILVDLLFATEHRSCQRNALDNLFVAGAAADIATDGVLICSSVGSGSSAISAAPAMTMPGMQKPHCTAPTAPKAYTKASRTSSGRPSTVTMLRPAARAVVSTHALTAAPSTWMVQVPQAPSEQPSLAE